LSTDKPRRRIRLNRHHVFVLHILAFLAGGTWIWTLRAPTLDKQFDVLFWLALVAAHGLALYFRRRVAFLLQLLMFAAGNGAIWSTTAPVEDKIKVAIAWFAVCGLIGVWLFRRAVRSGMITPRAPVRRPDYDEDAADSLDDTQPLKLKQRRGS
jgi:hypothetical protein